MPTSENWDIARAALEGGHITTEQWKKLQAAIAASPETDPGIWLVLQGAISNSVYDELSKSSSRLELTVELNQHTDLEDDVSNVESRNDSNAPTVVPDDEHPDFKVAPNVRSRRPRKDSGSVPDSQPDDRYLLSKLHGVGGIGRIWVAIDRKLRREVALKELLPRRAKHQSIRARFLREARITGKLDHPGVAPIYELGRRSGSKLPFYTMRLVRGKTLQKAIRAYHKDKSDGKSRPLQLRRLIQAFVQICNTMAFAHSKNIVHRDLKPENILLGDFGDTVVLDWGLAKELDGSDDVHEPFDDIRSMDGESRTLIGQILGTPAYMSPEQAMGHIDRIDFRTDVYGLGTILYELLTNRPPINGKDHKERLKNVCNTPPTPPSQLVADTPSALEAICLKALAKQSQDRFQTVEELRGEIEAWLADEPVKSAPDSPLEKAARWLRRHRIAATAFGFTSLAVAIVATVAAILLNVERFSNAQLADRNRLLAIEGAFDRGKVLCDEGRIANGMHWFEHALSLTSPTDVDWRRTLLSSITSWRNNLAELVNVIEHDAEINVVRFSPDGKLLATGDALGNVIVFDADSCAKKISLKHDLEIRDIAFSQDGRWIATASNDCTMCIWELATGFMKWKPKTGSKKPINSVKFSPDNSVLVGANDDGTLYLFGIEKGDFVCTHITHGSQILAIDVSPNSKFVATASADCTSAVWDMMTGARIRTLSQPKCWVHAIVFSPDSNLVAVGNAETPVEIFDLRKSGDPVIGAYHVGGVRHLRFTPDGSRLISAGDDNTIHFWDLSLQRDATQAAAAHGAIKSMDLSHDGRWLATGGTDNVVRIWEVDSGLASGSAFEHEGSINNVAFSKTGVVATGGSDKVARIWKRPTELSTRVFQHGHPINCFAVSSSGEQFLTGDNDRWVKLWDKSNRTKSLVRFDLGSSIFSVAFHPQKNVAAFCASDSWVKQWDLSQQVPNGFAFVHPGPCDHLAFNSTGELLATACWNNLARVYRLDATEESPLEVTHKNRVSCVAFSPDSKYFATASWDGSACVWDVRTGEQKFDPVAHLDKVNGVAFSPDGTFLVTACSDRRIRFWSARTGEFIRASLVHDSGVRCLAFSPKGDRLISGSNDRTAKVLDVRTGRPIGSSITRSAGVIGVAFLNEHQVMVASADGQVGIHPLFPDVANDPTRIRLWIEVFTGTHLGEDDTVKMLTANEIESRRAELAELGGSPFGE